MFLLSQNEILGDRFWVESSTHLIEFQGHLLVKGDEFTLEERLSNDGFYSDTFICNSEHCKRTISVEKLSSGKVE